MSKIEAVTTSVSEYRAVIHRCFQERYANARDLWSREQAMDIASELLLKSLTGVRHSLDIGAGNGRDVVKFLQAGHRVTGVDLVANPTWPNLQQQWGERVSWVVAPFPDAPLRGPFEVIHDNGCFHHQHPDSYGLYLSRTKELLTQDGLLYLNVFAPDRGESRGALHQLADGRLSQVFTPEEISALLHRHGFRVTRTRMIERQLEGRYLAVWAVNRQ